MEVDFFREEIEKIYDLHLGKREDYTAGNHPLANYRFSAQMAGLATERGMFMRLMEKAFRIKSLYENEDRGVPPRNESMDDSDRDIAIIAILRILSRRKDTPYGRD